MTQLMNEHTRNTNEDLAQYAPVLHDRYQADFDYNGCLHADDDHADCYRPLAKAVRLG